MNCRLCSNPTKKIGVHEGFDIYQCDVCDTRCSDAPIPEGLYDQMGEHYEGQLKLARSLALEEDPSWTLVGRGYGFWGVFEYLRGKRGLTILDVGCGPGYLTRCLRMMGHDALGIDVAQDTIRLARETFGNFYAHGDAYDLSAYQRDLVVGLDIIEHLERPLDFLKACMNAGKEVLIATPNRSFFRRENIAHIASPAFNQGVVWYTEPPPIHLSLFTGASMLWAAKQLGARVKILIPPGLSDTRQSCSTLLALFSKP